MRIIGIIAEYNPFHNGHKYHLSKSRSKLKADYCIVVMSGNYVQRGEPSIIHKWKRAEMCLLGGADLVIELPVHYSTASAEYFAEGAVKLLNSTKIVNSLSFGAECPSGEGFSNVLNYIINEPPEYRKLLRNALSSGYSFPKARAAALAGLSDTDPKIYEAPNNILALEYLKALSKTGSTMEPYTVKRHCSSHNSDALSGQFSSASAIRKAILSLDIKAIEEAVPPSTFRLLSSAGDIFPISLDDYSDMLIYRIKTATAEELRAILDVSEGIENRITAAANNETISSIISQIKTKRYTFTKIQRILTHILLDITQQEMTGLMENETPYIRVLGFKRSAQPLVGRLVEEASCPVIINFAKDIKKLDDFSLKIIRKEISSTDIYFMKCHERRLRRKGVEFSIPPVII